MSNKIELENLVKTFVESKKEANKIVTKAITESRQSRQEREAQSNRQK